MLPCSRISVIVLALFCGAQWAHAGQVEVRGVHLCCGACVKGVGAALEGVEGVSNVASDRESRTVTFTAADDKAADAGIKALAKGGFHGTATHDNKPIEFPASGAKEGSKAGKITLSGVHLCCAACARAVEDAVRKVDGVTNVTVDREARRVEVTGDNVSVEAVVKALNDAGFHATVES